MKSYWRWVIPLAIVIVGAIFVLPIGTRRFAESPPKSEQQAQVQQGAAYVGSDKCATCHTAESNGWKKSRHSQMVQDAKSTPSRILADWSKPGAPTVAKRTDVAFAIGGSWLQRYAVQRGSDYYFVPAEWVVSSNEWRPYSPKPAQRPEEVWTSTTRSLHNTCQHCMTTGTLGADGSFREPSIGCERCHGPGATHIKTRSKADIINPRRLTYSRELDVCGSCHFRGTDKTGAYEDARGFKPGDDLTKFAILEKPDPGRETDAFFADGAAKKHHAEYQDFIQSRHYSSRIVTCSTRHIAHTPPQTVKDNGLCSKPGCHEDIAKDVRGHAQKAANRSDITLCVTCHMPQRATGGEERGVTSHTFKANQVSLKTAPVAPYVD